MTLYETYFLILIFLILLMTFAFWYAFYPTIKKLFNDRNKKK